MPATRPAVAEEAVIVRLRVQGDGWVEQLPVVPGSRHLTISVGPPELQPVPTGRLAARGYRAVGWSAHDPPLGPSVDVLVPDVLRQRHPDWWEELAALAVRVFDLRMGPVQRVLATEIGLHLGTAPGRG